MGHPESYASLAVRMKLHLDKMSRAPKEEAGSWEEVLEFYSCMRQQRSCEVRILIAATPIFNRTSDVKGFLAILPSELEARRARPLIRRSSGSLWGAPRTCPCRTPPRTTTVESSPWRIPRKGSRSCLASILMERSFNNYYVF
jgi:hypothetical protein